MFHGEVDGILAGNNRNLGILKIFMIQVPALLQVYEANAGTIATQKIPGVSSVDTLRCRILIILLQVAADRLWR